MGKIDNLNNHIGSYSSYGMFFSHPNSPIPPYWWIKNVGAWGRKTRAAAAVPTLRSHHGEHYSIQSNQAKKPNWAGIWNARLPRAKLLRGIDEIYVWRRSERPFFIVAAPTIRLPRATLFCGIDKTGGGTGPEKPICGYRYHTTLIPSQTALRNKVNRWRVEVGSPPATTCLTVRFPRFRQLCEIYQAGGGISLGKV